MKSLVCLLLLMSSLVAHSSPLLLITEELPPYAYREGGKMVGASVEIIDALFKEAKIPYKLQMFPWKRAFEKVKNSAACVFPIQRSQEREALFNWVSPVLVTQTGFYTKAGKTVNVRTIRDVVPYKIGTYRGSAVEEYLKGQGFEVDSTTKEEANIRKLKAGRLDLWAADTLSVAYMAKKNNIEVNEVLVYFTTLRALACNPDVPADTINQLRTALQSIYQKGVVDTIMKKYKS